MEHFLNLNCDANCADFGLNATRKLKTFIFFKYMTFGDEKSHLNQMTVQTH